MKNQKFALSKKECEGDRDVHATVGFFKGVTFYLLIAFC